MDIGVKNSAYGRVFLLVFLAVVVAFMVKVFLFDRVDPANSSSENMDKAAASAEQRNSPLTMEAVHKPSIPISLIASSVQDGNAVIRQQGKAKVISVGDELVVGALTMKVVQVSDQQLILRPANSNDIYLIEMSVNGAQSIIQKVSSDISLSNAMIDGAPNPNKP